MSCFAGSGGSGLRGRRWVCDQRHHGQTAAGLHRHALPDHQSGSAKPGQRQDRRAWASSFSRRMCRPGVGGGPLLLQAVYDGVQYNKTHHAGDADARRRIFRFTNRPKSPGSAKIQQHFFVLEPSPDGNMQVTEGFVYQNDGKTTWNDPDGGTLQFELPAAAQGKVEVNVRAPGGLPIRRAPDPLGKPNQFKLDFPIKPGESSVELTWAMPFQSPGVFEDHILSKAGCHQGCCAHRRRVQRRRPFATRPGADQQSEYLWREGSRREDSGVRRRNCSIQGRIRAGAARGAIRASARTCRNSTG